MNVSAAIAETEGRIHCGIPSSRHDHAKGARPRKRDGDAPGRGGPASRQADSPLGRSTYCFKYASLPSQARLWSLPRPLLQGGQPPCRIPTKGAHPHRNSQAGCYPASRLRAPVSRGDCAISRRTVMNNAGLQAAEKLCRHARTSRGHLSETSPVCLVDLVCFVYLVHPVNLVQPNKQDKPNNPIKRDRPDRPNRPNEQDRLADFFSILQGACPTLPFVTRRRRCGQMRGRRPGKTGGVFAGIH